MKQVSDEAEETELARMGIQEKMLQCQTRSWWIHVVKEEVVRVNLLVLKFEPNRYVSYKVVMEKMAISISRKLGLC